MKSYVPLNDLKIELVLIDKLTDNISYSSFHYHMNELAIIFQFTDYTIIEQIATIEHMILDSYKNPIYNITKQCFELDKGKTYGLVCKKIIIENKVSKIDFSLSLI